MKKTVVLTLFLFLSWFVQADVLKLKDNHPETYIVKKGDTLWDISGKFLKQPWKWAEIWEINPQVKNPHLIYPGDVLSLIYINGKPRLTLNRGESRGTVKLSPKIRTDAIIEAIPTIPLKKIHAFLVQNRIFADEVNFYENPYILAGKDGFITGSAAGNIMYARGTFLELEPEYEEEPISDIEVAELDTTIDECNCDPIPEPEPEPIPEEIAEIIEEPTDEKYSKYGIFRLGNKYKDPITKKFLGIDGVYIGQAEVFDIQGDIAKVVIQEIKREILPGDRLIEPEQDREFLSKFVMSEPDEPIDALIIDVPMGVERAGANDIVVINKGLNDNIIEGHVLAVYKTGETIKDRVTQRKVKLPDEKVAYIMVFRAYDNVSYALVLESEIQIGTGDLIRNPS